jgi:hypothetical protein
LYRGVYVWKRVYVEFVSMDYEEEEAEEKGGKR